MNLTANPTANLTHSLQLLKQSLVEFWTVRDARERALLTAAAAVMVLGLTYLLLFAPALAGREQLNLNLPLLRQQAAQMQSLAKEAALLSAKPIAQTAVMSKESLTAALTRNNLKAQNLMLSGDQVEVQLSAASFASTLTWLDEMQKTLRLSVVEANFVALDQPDMVNAKLTLRQPKNE